MNKKKERKQSSHTDIINTYIRIEIVDFFGNKKITEVSPYFKNQELTKSDFSIAIHYLEKEKDKVPDALHNITITYK